jgi:hypothetical protein
MKGVTNSGQSGLEGGAKSKNFDFRTFGGGASLYLFQNEKRRWKNIETELTRPVTTVPRPAMEKTSEGASGPFRRIATLLTDPQQA